MVSNLDNNIAVNTNHNLSFTKEITQTINNTTQIVYRLSCHIIDGVSISYLMQVLNLDLFNENKDIIQEEIDAFKEHTKVMASEHNVPII